MLARMAPIANGSARISGATGWMLATQAGATIAEIVRVTDPIAYLASLLVILAACLLAAWIPATRAARLDPMRTLRQE